MGIVTIHVGTEHRVLVATKFAGAIYVLHVVQKKSEKTPRRDSAVARRRHHDVLRGRGIP